MANGSGQERIDYTVVAGELRGTKKPCVFLLRERFGNAGQRITVLFNETCILKENTHVLLNKTKGFHGKYMFCLVKHMVFM